MVLKSDQEASIGALCGQVQMDSAAEVGPEEAPIEGHEKSNGEAGATIKEVCWIGANSARARLVLRRSGKTRIMAWIVEHAGTMLCLFSRGRDRPTPFSRLKGRPWRVALAPFVESVELCRRPRRKLEARLREQECPWE